MLHSGRFNKLFLFYVAFVLTNALLAEGWDFPTEVAESFEQPSSQDLPESSVDRQSIDSVEEPLELASFDLVPEDLDSISSESVIEAAQRIRSGLERERGTRKFVVGSGALGIAVLAYYLVHRYNQGTGGRKGHYNNSYETDYSDSFSDGGGFGGVPSGGSATKDDTKARASAERVASHEAKGFLAGLGTELSYTMRTIIALPLIIVVTQLSTLVFNGTKNRLARWWSGTDRTKVLRCNLDAAFHLYKLRVDFYRRSLSKSAHPTISGMKYQAGKQLIAAYNNVVNALDRYLVVLLGRLFFFAPGKQMPLSSAEDFVLQVINDAGLAENRFRVAAQSGIVSELSLDLIWGNVMATVRDLDRFYLDVMATD